MTNHLVLILCVLCLSWLAGSEDALEVDEIEEEEEYDFGLREFNDTDGKLPLPMPLFAQLNINDKVYSFNFLPVNWHTARELCTSRNQVIASVQSGEETVQIISALLKNGLLYSDSSFWIGGSQLGHLGQWSWASTGRQLFYTNWESGQPTYWNTHCLELLSDGKWRANDCDLKRAVICQDLTACSQDYLYG